MNYELCAAIINASSSNANARDSGSVRVFSTTPFFYALISKLPTPLMESRRGLDNSDAQIHDHKNEPSFCRTSEKSA
jgi:hypothetical protein